MPPASEVGAARRPVWSPLSFVAGLASGAAGQAVGHPLDTLKVHAQAASSERLALRSLWRGAAVPVATTGGIQSLALGIFENTRRALWPHASPTPLVYLAAAGSTCGVCVSLVTCPLQRIKVLQQLTGVSVAPVARAVIADGTLFRALPTAVLWESTRGSFFVLHALCKRPLQPAGDGTGAEPALPLWARILAAGTANVLNLAVLYPLNTIWNVQQSELPRGLEHGNGTQSMAQSEFADARGRGILATARALLEEGGVRRFYRGYAYTLLRAFPVAGVIMSCFEVMLPALERSQARLEGKA